MDGARAKLRTSLPCSYKSQGSTHSAHTDGVQKVMVLLLGAILTQGGQIVQRLSPVLATPVPTARTRGRLVIIGGLLSFLLRSLAHYRLPLLSR